MTTAISESELTGFRTWEDVEHVLCRDWERVSGGGALLLRYRMPDLVHCLEIGGRLRARERRGLHRAGMRQVDVSVLGLWEWSPSMPEPTGDFGVDLRAALPRIIAIPAEAGALATHVLRDVLRVPLHEVVVHLPDEDEDEPDWYDDEDEDEDED